MSHGISNFINLKNFLENKRGEAGYNIQQNFIYFSFEFRGFLEKRGNYCIGVTFKRLFSETQAFKTSETANQAALASTQRAKPRESAWTYIQNRLIGIPTHRFRCIKNEFHPS